MFVFPNLTRDLSNISNSGQIHQRPYVWDDVVGYDAKTASATRASFGPQWFCTPWQDGLVCCRIVVETGGASSQLFYHVSAGGKLVVVYSFVIWVLRRKSRGSTCMQQLHTKTRYHCVDCSGKFPTDASEASSFRSWSLNFRASAVGA